MSETTERLFDPLKHAVAEIFCVDAKDWRIKWVGPGGEFLTGISYGSKEVAKMMATDCGARKIV